jgi:hypothetical protein
MAPGVLATHLLNQSRFQQRMQKIYRAWRETPSAAAFWTRRSFIPSKDNPLVPFRSMADVAASVTAAGRRN